MSTNTSIFICITRSEGSTPSNNKRINRSRRLMQRESEGEVRPFSNSEMTQLRCHLLLWSCFLIKLTLSSGFRIYSKQQQVPPVPKVSLLLPFLWQLWIKYSLFIQVLSAVWCAALLLIGRQSSKRAASSLYFVACELYSAGGSFLLVAKALISPPPIFGNRQWKQQYLLLLFPRAFVCEYQQDGFHLKVGKAVDCLIWALAA